MEEEQSRYIFPGDSPTTVADNPIASKDKSGDGNKIDQDWQFIVADPSTPPQITVSSPSASVARSDVQSMPKLFPGGISYLREMGTRKIGALKQRLSSDRPSPQPMEEEEEETKRVDDDNWDEVEPPLSNFVDVLETPSVTPEMITTAQGPRIVVKNHNTRSALFALHERQETVSVHNLNMDPEPFNVFCLPENCQDVLVTQNTIYTVQRVNAGQRNGRVGSDGVAEGGTGEEGVKGEEDGDKEPQQVIACGVVSKTLSVKNKEADGVSGINLFERIYVSSET